MPYHSSDEEMNTTASTSATTRTRSTRRDRRPVGGRIRRRRGDDSDSSEEDKEEEVDLDRLKKKSTSSENAASDLTNDGDTEMADGNDKNDNGNDNDNFKSKEHDEHQMFPSQQQDDSSQTQTQTQTLDQSQETSSPHGLAIGDADSDTLRILLSTDNHLGYAEDDNIRGNDTFSALEEVLFLAKEYRCDMVLLGGDLFHHNRPSRRTLYKTMEIFKRYCMGPGAIQVQIISGSADAGGGGGKNNSPLVRGFANYEDENYSVDLPVFSIHGNHDDPSRDGGNSELYAALDLLDVSNLVNYFGKQEDTKDIRVDPILLRKGKTHVALYGLGSMRDERLNRMWRGEHLTFSRPAEDHNGNNNNNDGEEDNGAPQWFNIFTLHQNRDRGRGTKNCIKEDMIPDWMDFICWGHEHECDIEVTESVVGTFRISQPGSSVATSLVEGESMRKKIGILDIREGQFRLTTVPLTQVRSFVLGTVRLADVPKLDPDEPKVDIKVSKVLEDKVRVLIHDAREKRLELFRDAEESGNTLAKYYNNGNLAEIPLKHTLHKEEEVLVRLKVDHTGFAAVNNQRFGAKFVGDIANPTDILLFTRKRNESKSNSKSMKDIKPIEPSDVEEMDIEELIVEQFEVSNTKLELFDDKKISLALDQYVGKQEAKAINEVLDKLLGKQQNRLIKSGAETAAEGLEGKLKTEDVDELDTGKKKKGKTNKRNPRGDYADEEDVEQSLDDDDVMEEDPPLASSSRSRSTKKGTQNSTSSKKRVASSRKDSSYYEEDDDDDDDDEFVEAVKSKSKSRSTTSRNGRGRKNVTKRTEESEDDDSDIQVVDPPPRNRGARNRTTKKPVAYSMNNSDDDDDDDIVVVDDSDDSSPPRKKTGRGRTAAAKKNTKKLSTSTKKRDRDSTGSNLSQSQLSFTSVKHARQPTNRRKTTTRKSRYNNDVDSDDGDDNFQPAGRTYDDDDDDWGTAQSNTASTF